MEKQNDLFLLYTTEIKPIPLSELRAVQDYTRQFSIPLTEWAESFRYSEPPGKIKNPRSGRKKKGKGKRKVR